VDIEVTSDEKVMRSSRSRGKKVFKFREKFREGNIGAAFSSRRRRRTINIKDSKFRRRRLKS
jgi:hypothetical protein